jgi:hypothetical protein
MLLSRRIIYAGVSCRHERSARRHLSPVPSGVLILSVRTAIGILFLSGFLTLGIAHGQQFNSDNYLSKPHGVATIILTYGQRDAMFMNTFSLIRNWEFTAAAYLYNSDNDPTTNDGYSTSLYFKYMVYENEAKTGGIAVKGGTGLKPSYVGGDYVVKDAFKTYWMNAPVTLALFDNKLSWDLMPGTSVTLNYGTEKTTAWAFTYSTRLAWYMFGPELSVVGEVFGAEGEAKSIPEYKIGPRWEPNQYAVFAITYGDEFLGTHGARWQVGVMLFTPPFACLGGCE